MRRLPLLPLLLLTLILFAACGPQTADRGPSLPPSTVNGPSSTVSPTTPTVDRGLWTVTPTAYPLSSIISADLQHTLESRQGWLFTWDAGRAAYLITQRAWDADKAQFTSSTLGEIGYLDAEGRLHLHVTSFSARPGEKSAYVADQTHAEISLPLSAAGSPLPAGEGPGVRVIETKNPLYEKTGILKITDENGVTYVYSPASALTSEQTINGKKVKVVEFATLEKNDQGVMALTLDALHTGFPVAWLIAQGYDRPFSQEALDNFPTWAIQFNYHPENSTKDAVLWPRSGKTAQYFRYLKDQNKDVVWFFVTDSQGNSFFTLPFLTLNPQDPSHPKADETMFLFGALGTMNQSQYNLFDDVYLSNHAEKLKKALQ